MTNAMTILDKISEAEILQWMEARIEQARATLPSVTSLDASCCHYDHMEAPKASFEIHGNGECVLNAGTVTQAVIDLRILIVGDPAKKAQAAREKAERLLEQAREYDALATE